MSVQPCGSNNLTCLSDASALLQHIYYHGCPPQNHACETSGISRRALLQSHSQEESSPHLARVFQRPRLAHDFTVHVNEAGNRTPNYSSGAPPTPLSRDLPPSCSRESMRCCLTFPLYLSRLGYPLSPPVPPTPPSLILMLHDSRNSNRVAAPHTHILPLCSSPLDLLLQKTDHYILKRWRSCW